MATSTEEDWLLFWALLDGTYERWNRNFRFVDQAFAARFWTPLPARSAWTRTDPGTAARGSQSRRESTLFCVLRPLIIVTIFAAR
jgi:hypothetical protein